MDLFVAASKEFELADETVELSVATVADRLVVMMECWKVVNLDAFLPVAL